MRQNGGLTPSRAVFHACLLLLQKHHRVFVNLSSDTFAKDSQLRDILQCNKLQQPLRKFNSILGIGKSPMNIPEPVQL
jgi:hypothetical protein